MTNIWIYSTGKTHLIYFILTKINIWKYYMNFFLQDLLWSYQYANFHNNYVHREIVLMKICGRTFSQGNSLHPNWNYTLTENCTLTETTLLVILRGEGKD